MAQSTIFNIPSTDTVSKGKGYFEFDFLAQAPGPESGSRTYIYNPRILVGLSDKAEVGLNFPTYHASSNFGYIQPNIKYKYYANDDAGVAVSAGIVWNTPLNQREGQDSWGYIYTNLSKKVKSGNYGPRFTVGPYGVLGANRDPRVALPASSDSREPASFSDTSNRFMQKPASSPTGLAARTVWVTSLPASRSRFRTAAC